MKATMITELKEALNLDIYDINYKLSSEKKATVDKDRSFSEKGLPYWMYRMLLKSVREISKDVKHYFFSKKKLEKRKNLFFVNTDNQHDAIKSIEENLNNSFTCTAKSEKEKGMRINTGLACLISLFYFPVVVEKYIQCDGYMRRSMKSAFAKYWLSYGAYVLVKKIVEEADPRTVILSNDHSMWPRLFLKISHLKDVKTFFVQHASATKGRPPMELSIPLFEGRYSLNKYRINRSKVDKVYLIGMPRFDKYADEKRKITSIDRVGVCSNKFTSTSKIEDIIRKVVSIEDVDKIFYRPHPSESTDDRLEFIDNKDVNFSDPKIESAFEFLTHVDTIISGDSNIILEASILNVPSIYFEFENGLNDLYGFVENEVSLHVCNVEKLPGVLEKCTGYSPRCECKFYSETIDTKYDGRSSELASSIIELESGYRSERPEGLVVDGFVGDTDIPVIIPK